MQFMGLVSTQTSVIQTRITCQFASINRKMVIIVFPCVVVLESFDHLDVSEPVVIQETQEEGIVHH